MSSKAIPKGEEKIRKIIIERMLLLLPLLLLLIQLALVSEFCLARC